MQFALFDSSIYISAFRRGESATFAPGAFATKAPLVLSAVVLEELYAGASERDRETVEQLELGFQRVNRIVTPTLDDWAQAGKVLARLAEKYGYEEIGRGRLTNDALIAMSASRMGIVVITTNARDFRRLAEFLSIQWQHVEV